jgi:hypothetical protein
MNGGSATPSRSRGAGAADCQAHDELLELRSLLLGVEQQRINRLEDRLDNPESRADEIGPLLPAIVRRAVETNALALSESLFVVLGPAIRNAISAALHDMLVNLDRVLQNSLSPMAWRWRIEAIRTGKPFAEIVLLHSLQYRVEQVFLVHRDTSLLIRDVRAPSATQKDPDEVSAMLAAIQDFVRDSFQSEAGAEASTVRVGDISLYVEHGPLAFLAAAIRGTPPLELRAHMRTVIESIHLSSYALLRGYQGHAAGFESCTGLLETCLQFRLQSPEKSRKPVFAYTFVLIVALVLGIGVGLLVTENMRWKRYVATPSKVQTAVAWSTVSSAFDIYA